MFVEGRKRGGAGDGTGGREGEGDETVEMGLVNGLAKETTTSTSASLGAGPGGKGHGNKWLYVSHEPIPPISSSSAVSSQSTTATTTSSYYHDLFNLTPTSKPSTSHPSPTSPPRLIKLTFSPLILHILCSSLHTAKPLLAAAINAGFRESGVQSLKILERQDQNQNGEAGVGVMVAVRTAGCGFESVIGYVEESSGDEAAAAGEKGEVYRSVVSEEWLGVLVAVVTGRFEENVGRRERFRAALGGVGVGNGDGMVGEEWEDKEVRRRRKREEGLRVKREKEREGKGNRGGDGGANGEKGRGDYEDDNDNGLGGGLFLDSA